MLAPLKVHVKRTLKSSCYDRSGGVDMEHFERLKVIREDRDLTQSNIAELLQTTRQQVSKWENGTQMMGVDKYIVLAKYYNLSLDYLLGLTDQPQKLK